MYSSSSSDCDCVDYSLYAQDLESDVYFGQFPNVRPTPWYPSMGNPLVYYAQVTPANKRQRNSDKRKRPNCFVKAFRWYTQERVPDKREDDVHISCFAAWLDAKYGEFLQSNDDRVASFKVKNVSTLEVKTSNPECDECCSPDKSPHRKRTWRKRKHMSKERGDLNNETVISRTRLETILHPKDLTGPASEYWHPNGFKTQDTNGNQSTFTITTCDSPCSDKTSKMCAYKDDCAIPHDSKIEMEQEIRVIDPDTCSAKERKRPKTIIKSSSSKLARATDSLIKRKQFSCQYPEEQMQRYDAQMQHEVSKVDKTCSGCDTELEMGRKKQSWTDTKAQPKYKNTRRQRHEDIDYTDVSCQCSRESIQKRHYHYDIGSAHHSCQSHHQVHNRKPPKTNKPLAGKQSIKHSQQSIYKMDCVCPDVLTKQTCEDCNQYSDNANRCYENRHKQGTKSKSDYKQMADKKTVSQHSIDSSDCTCRGEINKHKIHSYGLYKHDTAKKYSSGLHSYKQDTRSKTNFRKIAAENSARRSHQRMPSTECLCYDLMHTHRVDAFSQYKQEISSDSYSCDTHTHKQESQASASQRLLKIDDRETCRDARCCDIENCIAGGPRPYSAVCDVAQTSDLSLNLAKESRHRYPLFMKIVRADKN